MTTKLGKPGFSRRVVTYYLFFCMLAVTWLSIGVLTTVQSVLSSRATSNCLSRLGQLAAAVEMDLLRNHGRGCQDLIEQANARGSLAFCSIVADDGRYFAHTTRPLIGSPVVEPSGSHLRWGSIDGIRYEDAYYGMLSEYRTPLSVNGEKHGTLRLGVVEPDFFVVVSEVADSAPLAVLLPLGCVIAGAFLLRKTAQPFAAIDQRLRDVAQTPYGQSVQLERIQESGVAAAGWNRLVDQINATPDELDEEDSIDRKLAEALNRRRGSQSLEVLQALRDGIAVTDPRGRIEFANAAIASLLDLESCDSLTDEALCSALAASTKGADAFAASCPTTPVVAEVEASCESEDNARTLRVERQPLDGSEGRSVWSIRDITQQKLAEKSRDQFIDAATHELRTPLANIKAYAETLATCEVDDPEQQKEFFNTINSEATRLGRFVDDLLDISSMEVGSLTIRRQNVEVERLLRESADKIKPLVEKKLQQFEVVLPPKLGEMHLDKDKLSAMVVNLLGNASKYTPEGGTVRLKAELGEDALTVIVSDTGVGISPEELPRVFEKFFRSEDPRVRNETGTGLGLSLAREIARLHGGDIHAVSTVGEGSSFVITLPRTERDAV